MGDTTWCLYTKKRLGRPQTPEDTVESIEAIFYTLSLNKSTLRASKELHTPQSTVWRVLRKCMRLKPYKMQLLPVLRHTDEPKRRDFCLDMIEELENDGFADRLVFSDEATFHLSRQVNRHNVRIYRSENPRELIEYVRDFPKQFSFLLAIVWCMCMYNRPF